MEVTGRCHCGAISYRASVDPEKVNICHCTDCGSPVYATTPGDNPPSYMLRVGALDQRASLPPRRQIWCKSAVPWSANIKEIPGIDRQ